VPWFEAAQQLLFAVVPLPTVDNCCLRVYGGFTIVRAVAAERPKPVEWIGSSRTDLLEFPVTVRSVVGYALYQAQVGLKHRDAKRLRGLGGNIVEISSRHDGDAFRVVYTVRFKSAIYVLHAFQKKAKRGIATPKQEIDLVRRRLEAAQKHYDENYGGG